MGNTNHVVVVNGRFVVSESGKTSDEYPDAALLGYRAAMKLAKSLGVSCVVIRDYGTDEAETTYCEGPHRNRLCATSS